MTTMEQQIMIRRLLETLDKHHPGEAAHANRVAVYSVATGEKLGMDDVRLAILYAAAMLHDIGKLGISPALLASRGTLSAEERAEIQSHVSAEDGAFAQESGAWLASLRPIIRSHHERWDGCGYPDGLSGERIPIEARVIAAAEVFDTLAFGAVWKEPVGEAEAMQEIEACSGDWFDPSVVEALKAVQPKIQPIID